MWWPTWLRLWVWLWCRVRLQLQLRLDAHTTWYVQHLFPAFLIKIEFSCMAIVAETSRVLVCLWQRKQRGCTVCYPNGPPTYGAGWWNPPT